ncbi:MAG: iron-sulfur cluster insertion protein ErpA [Pseudomonadota bacterium]
MSITLTDSLVKRIQTLREEQNKPDMMLRVQVNGGGCQGFEYMFDFADDIGDDDEVFEKDGVRVLVDSVSFPYLNGSEIDYKNELIGAHFAVNNPNASSSCGCGTSFSV